VITIGDHTFSLKDKDEQHIVFRSSSSQEITVGINETQRTVHYNDEQYLVSLISTEPTTTYSVTLPDQAIFKVRDAQGFLFELDDKGELAGGISITVDTGYMKPPLPEQLFPSKAVGIAYPQYYEHRGILPIFILSWIFMLIGFTIYRFEAVQNILFRLSLYSLFTVNPEPTDFYYFTQRISGIIIIIVGLIGLFNSLFTIR